MNKKLLVAALIGIAILGGIIFWSSKNSKPKEQLSENNKTSSEMIFFYGQGCPHCVNVEKFLEENKSVEEKVKFEKKEIWGNKENSQLMMEKAKVCGLSSENLGVPFFWDGSKCFTGDVDIINLLKDKAGIQQ